VERADAAILDELRAGPRTLRELIDRCGPRIGGWPQAVNIELCFAFSGHVERLEGRGAIRREPGSRPARYVLGEGA